MTSSDFGYRVLDKENSRRRRQAENNPRVEEVNNAPRQRARFATQGPLQQQRRFPLMEEASSSSQYFDDIDFIRSSMLPQVFEALGEEGRESVVNEIRGRQRAEERRARRERGEPLVDYELATRPQETRFYGIGETLPGGGNQLAIPGLNYQIDESNKVIQDIRAQGDRKRIEGLLQKYPELESMLKTPAENRGTVATRIDPKSFDKYKQYTDLAQMYSDPSDRAKVYTSVLEDLYDYDDEYSADAARAYADVKRAEELYTSGDARQQETAREILRGYGEDLSGVEKPAFQPNKPIIGGGGYVNPGTDDDIKYINQRAKDYLDATAISDFRSREALERDYPGIQRPLPYNDTERTYYSATDYIDDAEFDPDNPGTRIDVSRGASYGRLQDFTDLPDDAEVSRNVVRFLKDNPGLEPASVAFKVATPGEDDMSYDAKELPDDVQRPVMRFVQEASMADRRGGSILNNSPMANSDLLQKAYEEGLDEKTSSYLRQVQPFVDASVQAPNLRGKAYTLSGYGPTDRFNDQYTYIDNEGKAIPLQITRPETPLVGSVNVFKDLAESKPAAPYKSQPRFYSTLVPGLTPEGVQGLELKGLAKNVRKVPASLAPGVADLIPSAQSVRLGYEQGPVAMYQNMAKEFIEGLPVAAAAVPILAGPAAPFAPGIGAGLIGSSVVEAADEVVRQETGEGIVPKVRQFLGTRERTGMADELPSGTGELVTPELTVTKKRNPIERITDGIRARTDLAGERFNPRRGEFGLSELIFGR